MKKNHRLFFTALLLLMFVNGFTQTEISFGIKAGLSIPNLRAPEGDNPVANDWTSRTGPYFGIVSEFSLSDRFSIQPELNYSSQGGKKSGLQAIATSDLPAIPPGAGDFVYANFDSKAILNYIELPVLAKYNFPIGTSLTFFIDAGPYAGYLLNAKNISTGSSVVYDDKEETRAITPGEESFDSTQNVTDQLNRFNAGIQGGIGISLNVATGKLMLSGGGNYGLINIQKGTAHGKNNTGAATVTLGYLIHL